MTNRVTTKLDYSPGSIFTRPEVAALWRTSAAYSWDILCDRSRLLLQSNPNLKLTQLAKKTISAPKQNFDGAVVYAGRRFAKEGVRYFSMGPFNNFFMRLTGGDKLKSKVGTGVAMAVVDNVLLPFDMLFIRKIKGMGYGEFFKEKVKVNGPVELYRAVVPSLWRSISSWSVFMATNHLSGEKVKQLDPTNEHPVLGYGFQVLSTLFSTTAVMMPFDNVRTRMQLNESFQKMGTTRTFAEIIKTDGIFALWRGSSPYMVRQGPHTALGLLAVNQILKASENKQ